MSDSQAPERSTGVVTVPPSRVELAHVSDRRGTLTVLLGLQAGAAFQLNAQATLVGRNPRAHVVLDDEGVSRSHARILHADGCYEIEDLGSTNGVYVDGLRVDGRGALKEGARIQIGHAVLRFSKQDSLEFEAARRLYEASVRDALTGTFNRRHFEERLISEFAFAQRHGSALCVLLADVDHFKRINDRWGHPAGDHVLSSIGAALRAAVRLEDLVARYGGEEFVVLARGIDPSGTHAFAERLRMLIEELQIDWEGTRLPVRMSIGVAHNHAGAAASDPQRIVSAADEALYAAKAGGRNRVAHARSPGRYAIASPEGPAPATTEKRQSAWTEASAARATQDAVKQLPLERLRRSPKTTKLT